MPRRAGSVAAMGRKQPFVSDRFGTIGSTRTPDSAAGYSKLAFAAVFASRAGILWVKNASARRACEKP